MANGTQFVPLTPALIDEGQFLRKFKEDLADLQERLINHLAEYGERAGKASAELTVKVKLRVTNAESGHLAIDTSSSIKLPGRPKVSTAGFAAFEDGRPCLFVRGSGSTPGDPTQTTILPGVEDQPAAQEA